MKAVVNVMPKLSVLDPQGAAVAQAMMHHGMHGVGRVRVGKIIEIELDAAPDESTLHALCKDLLSNPVIEDYSVELVD